MDANGDECVFCDIVVGKEAASPVYEDGIAMAFMTIEPVNPGHVLVIPREHAAYLADLDEETGAHLFRIAMRLQGASRRSALRCEGSTFSWPTVKPPSRMYSTFISTCSRASRGMPFG